MGLTTLVPLPQQEWPDSVPEVCLVAGDLPAAVKLAPIATAMRARRRVRPVLLACGAHGPLVAETLAEFGLIADVLIGTRPEDTAGSAAQLLAGLDHAYGHRAPAAVLVQGDSASAFSAAMAAFWRRIPVVHVDAGVRSHDLTQPFPAEGHRKLIAQVCSLHLTSTKDASVNLADEAHARPQVLTVGSTAVDAGFDAIDRHLGYPDLRVQAVEDAVLCGESRMVLVVLDPAQWSPEATRSVLCGLRDLVLANPDLEIVLPAGPWLRATAEDVLGRLVRVTITGPLAQPELVCLLSVAAAVVTDRDTLTELAPSFGVPVLAIGGQPGTWSEPTAEGYPWLAGPERTVVAGITEKLVLSVTRPDLPSAGENPFGDGFAAVRCEQAVEWLLGLHDRPGDFVAGAS